MMAADPEVGQAADAIANGDASGPPSESIRHFLIECPRWDNQRQALKQAAGTRCADLSYLLGGWSDTKNPDGTYVDGPRERWKPDRKVVSATIAFAKSTRRLEMGKGAE